MTKKDLEQFDVFYIGSKIYPNKFLIPKVGEDNLYEPYSIDAIFDLIYERGYKDGTKYGEDKKIIEIKNVLNIQE